MTTRNEIMRSVARRDPARFRTRTVETEQRKQRHGRARRKQRERRDASRD